jgi:ABC-type multidrug transport system ATPase subunit
MPTLINVKNLSKTFGKINAVDALSFSVEEGRIYGFLGQNGAGKSTTIRMLLTLVKPDNGEIEIFGMDLFKHRYEILKQVGAIVERPDLYKYLTAFENLKIYAALSEKKITERSISDKLELVGLSERRHDKVKTFSQGMKQRLGIAVALVHDPRLLILDEPTNGLDPQGIADMRNLLLQLSKEAGKTLLISSHLLTEVEMIADDMLIIDRGKKVIEGKVKELLNPAQTLVEIETAYINETYEKLLKGKWKEYVLAKKEHSILFSLHINQVPALNRELVQMGQDVYSIRTKHSLEDFFISITTGKQHVETFTD